MSDKIQLNAKVVPQIKDTIEKVRAKTRFTREDIAEVAYATLFGARDNLIEAKRKKIAAAVKEEGIRLSFEFGLAC